MKRKFFFTASVLMAAFTLTGLTSCSDDDDNGGNGSKNLAYPSPTLVDSNGNKVYVSSIGELERASYSPFWSYTYDDAGNISEFSCIDNFDAIASGSTIVYNYGSGNRTIEIEIGSNGLISKMKEERTEKRWGVEEKYTTETLLTYNKDKQLVKMSRQNNTETYNEESKEWIVSESELDEISNTWENGNLVKSDELLYTDRDGSSTYTYIYNYGTQANPAKQYPTCMMTPILDNEGVITPLFFMGFFGYGPANLPTGMDITYKDGYYSDSYGYNFSITLNSNGTIDKETNKADYYTQVMQWKYNNK